MTNRTYLAGKRGGGRSNCAANKRRISVTIPEETFMALRERADRQHRGLSGEAAELISSALNAPSMRVISMRNCDHDA